MLIDESPHNNGDYIILILGNNIELGDRFGVPIQRGEEPSRALEPSHRRGMGDEDNANLLIAQPFIEVHGRPNAFHSVLAIQRH
jgi:hypothetical protein